MINNKIDVLWPKKIYLLQAFGYQSVAFNGYECMKYETIVYYCIYRKISIIAYEIW
jgi:hypothetical protein